MPHALTLHLPGCRRRASQRPEASGLVRPDRVSAGSPPRPARPCLRLLHVIVVGAAAVATGCGTGPVTETVRRAQQVAVAAAAWQRGDMGGDGVGLLSAEHRGTSLSVEVARSLARNPLSIFLRDLVALEPSAAESLAATRASLHFDRLAALSPGVARALAAHRCLLRLDAVADLEPDVAEALADHAGALSLDGLTHLDTPTARALGRHRGFLSLNGLEVLTASVAEALADHDGDLCLNAVRELSGPAARALARNRHSLYLVDLVHLDDDAIDALVEHQGRQLTCGPDVILGRRWMTTARRREELRRLATRGDRSEPLIRSVAGEAPPAF